MPRNLRLFLRTAAFLFAVLFTTGTIAQYLFLRSKLNGESESYLRNGAQELRGQIAFADMWDLRGYRRWAGGPAHYLVIVKNGTLVDT